MPRWTPRSPGSRAALQVGCMNFGKRTSAADAERIVGRALDRGLVFFDTANRYCDGESERVLGRALGKERDRCVVATKVGFGLVEGRPEGLSRSAILTAIDQSLARLGTDRIDLYYLHVPDYETPVEESLDTIGELLEAKKILAWGVSNHASWQILEMMHLAERRKMPGPVMSQQLYNVLIRQLEIEYFKFTRKHPVYTTVYNPLAGGVLTGKHRRGEPPAGSVFQDSRLYRGRYWSDETFVRVEALAEVAHSEGVTLTELAYAWVAGRSGVDAILVGASTVEHLDAAIDACEKDLSAEARARIDALRYAWNATDATYAR